MDGINTAALVLSPTAKPASAPKPKKEVAENKVVMSKTSRDNKRESEKYDAEKVAA